MTRWKLEGFTDGVDRWRAQTAPSNELVRDVVTWFLEYLAIDPFQAAAAPVGGPFPVTWWFARLPYVSASGDRIVCMYEINALDHTLTCRVVHELAEPIVS